MITAVKMGFVYKAEGKYDWWNTHLMAPAPIIFDDETIRVYGGAWDQEGISRITYVDLDISDPKKVKGVADNFILDIGEDGCFDDNGVFPAHVYNWGGGKVWLFYTGFQHLKKIAFTNFTGLAVSDDGGNTFRRYSKAPTLDRSDEGLFTRAGQSIFPSLDGGCHCVYSAGSGWFYLKGKERPIYEVYYQKSVDGIHLKEKGEKVVSCDLNVEHGLGRPQIIKLGEYYYVFYTRRVIKDMRYFLGCSRTLDFQSWERCDYIFDGVEYGIPGEFDSQMIYFPGVVKINEHTAYCFYTGNHYGEDGIGYIRLNF